MKIRNLCFITILSFTLFIACSDSENDEISSTKINFIEIGKGFLVGDGVKEIEKKENFITNTIEWENLVTKMNSISTVSNNFTETNIDFTKYIVLARFHSVTNGETNIEIVEILEKNGLLTLSVEVSETINTGSNSIFTQPFHIVKVLKTDISK